MNVTEFLHSKNTLDSTANILLRNIGSFIYVYLEIRVLWDATDTSNASNTRNNTNTSSWCHSNIYLFILEMEDFTKLWRNQASVLLNLSLAKSMQMH